MDLQLAGKTALVMAASKGLGRASALALAQEGCDLVICARSEAIHDAAKEIVAETGRTVLPVQADVTVQSDIDQVVQAAWDRFERVDILVLNAGGPTPGNFLDLKPEDWDEAVTLTLMSAVRFCYSLIPHMLEKGGGSIVAIESVSIKQPVDQLILSNSVRLAVIGLLKSLANEFGSRGIRVNSLNPTYTWTERVELLLTLRAAQNGTSLEEEKVRLGQTLPLGRLGTAEEFGRTLAWLASPAASFIHGHALMFDGGHTRSPL